MKRIMILVIALALMGSLSILAFGQMWGQSSNSQKRNHQKADPKTVTLTGEVVDLNCYMAAGAHGAGHKQCALMCLKAGAPAGLLTHSGKVYLIVSPRGTDPNTKLMKYVADQVKVRGKEFKRGGLDAVNISTISASTQDTPSKSSSGSSGGSGSW
ncbi:MAG: hypothetical protein M1330_00560 [Armatimonadetes bacterium]|nr:hypothetical protein [Armatimonadota bacterium]